MSGWAPILAAARVERERFERASAEPRAAQAWLLREILAENADCAFGRAHGFADIETVEAFRTSVPIRDYEGLRPWIERDADRATPTPNPSPPQVGLARLAHDDAKPGQARVSWGGEHTEQAAPPCINLIETRISVLASRPRPLTG